MFPAEADSREREGGWQQKVGQTPSNVERKMRRCSFSDIWVKFGWVRVRGGKGRLRCASYQVGLHLLRSVSLGEPDLSTLGRYPASGSRHK